MTNDTSVPDRKKRMAWALRVGAAIGGAWLCVGCAYAVAATDGNVFEATEKMPDPLSSALRSSGSHDLQCEPENVAVDRPDADRKFAVSGCGRRVLYGVLTPAPMRARVQLVSSSPSSPARDPSAAVANQPASGTRGG